MPEKRQLAAPETGISIRAGLGGRSNALNFIRLLLAAAVIVSHAFPLGGLGEDPFFTLFRGQENLGGVAVIGFFAISGYLITRSGMQKDIVQYLWARALRIFPAFWLVLLVAAAMVGPALWLVEGRALDDYVSRASDGPVAYLLENGGLRIGQWGIYDLLTGTPYGQVAGSVFNGSLWTLIYEWNCYLLIGALVIFGSLNRTRFAVPILTAVVFSLQVARFAAPDTLGALVPWFADPLQINLAMAFLWGACIAMYADRILVDDRIGLMCGFVVVFTLLQGGFALIGFPAFAYVLFWLAIRLPARVKKIGAVNDYSYGVYLYGFLVQQVLAYAGVYEFGYVPYTVSALVITFALAWLSWHALEKRALMLKDWGPGRGIRWWYDRARRLVTTRRKTQ
ncbi:acyltransferase [Mycetocola sp. 2940]|uniref:acyltransferase family protein n=1 Tax=Mycetocola sp. 2940 TaxID=3156452 RepID=UPI00339220A2